MLQIGKFYARPLRQIVMVSFCTLNIINGVLMVVNSLGIKNDYATSAAYLCCAYVNNTYMLVFIVVVYIWPTIKRMLRDFCRKLDFVYILHLNFYY